MLHCNIYGLTRRRTGLTFAAVEGNIAHENRQEQGDTMTTKKTSQEQHEGAPRPFPTMPGLDLWRAMFEAQTARFDAMLVEMERLERERHERSVQAIDDVTRLVKSTLDYQRDLAGEWRKLGLDAAKKSAELVGAA